MPCARSAYKGTAASVIIPEGVTEIDDGAFRGCMSLEEIRFAGSRQRWSFIYTGGDWHTGVPAKSVICTDGEVAL